MIHILYRAHKNKKRKLANKSRNRIPRPASGRKGWRITPLFFLRIQGIEKIRNDDRDTDGKEMNDRYENQTKRKLLVEPPDGSVANLI
jgi:hypothetical protein